MKRFFSRRLLALALCLLLLLAFLPTAHAAGRPVTTQQTLQTEIDQAAPRATTTIELQNDIKITDTLTIQDKYEPGNPSAPAQPREIILTAVNGAKLIATPDFHGDSMISVVGSCKLTIQCEIVANERCSAVSVSNIAGLTLGPGADLHGGSEGVSVNGAAKFSMTGGSVRDNSNNGISVNSSSSDIRISGGSIENNGTGVYVGSGANLTLSGGTITGNTNKDVSIVTVRPDQSSNPVVTISGDVTANIQIEGLPSSPGNVTALNKPQLTINHSATLNGNVTVGGVLQNFGPASNVQNDGTINGSVSLGNQAKLDNTNGKITGVVVTEGTYGFNGTPPDGGIVTAGTPYTINASAGENGSIAPSGAVSAIVLGSQLFTITPNEGYVIEDVKVDGKSVGAVSSYTLTVTKNHEITATFKPEQSQPEPEPEQPSAPDSSFTEPSYYPDYDEDAPAEEEQPEEEEAPLYMVTCRTLNVRTGPGTSFSKIGTLSRGALLSGELENGWLKFPYEGQTAYCSAEYLTLVSGDLTGLHVTCRTLNVRAGAGTNYPILGTLSRGTAVEILDVLPGWYEIDFLGGKAYVSSSYIG